MALETYILLKDKTKVQDMAKTITKRLTEKQWMSTQSTAYSLLAMAKFAEMVGDFAQKEVTYTALRDDRANFYFDIKKNETKTFRILLNASYLGRYYLPGIQADTMYDHVYMLRTQEQWLRWFGNKGNFNREVCLSTDRLTADALSYPHIFPYF